MILIRYILPTILNKHPFHKPSLVRMLFITGFQVESRFRFASKGIP